MKMLFLITFCAFGSVLLFLAWASYPWSLGEKKLSIPAYEVEPEGVFDYVEHPAVIKILTFNIGFLYGKGSEGPGYTHREASFYQMKLKEISQEIKAWGADVVCLQEVDFDSSRSHYINQAQSIARLAGYPYVAEAPSWKAGYIPFPYWPLHNNFGKMKSGGAILSRFPLSNHEVILLQKPKSQPWWYNLFYLHRYFQKVTLDIEGKNLNIINLHLEAFDKEDRKQQLQSLVLLANSEKTDIIAGDFNMLPDSAFRKSNFFNEDNYENDGSFAVMRKSGYSEVFPEEIYSKDESKYFTFPSWSPDRRLDYIWFRQGLKMMKAEVLPSAVSDHLPLRASFQIGSPKFNLYSQ